MVEEIITTGTDTPVTVGEDLSNTDPQKQYEQILKVAKFNDINLKSYCLGLLIEFGLDLYHFFFRDVSVCLCEFFNHGLDYNIL